MKLAVFDIDGTLTNTNRADEEAFRKAFQKVFGLTDLSTDWGSYAHSTDSGIFDQVIRERFNRPPTSGDIDKFISHFIFELEDAHRRDPNCFLEIAGSTQLIAQLPSEGWKVAIATGAWRKSAEFKLRRVGLSSEKFPFAFAEDEFRRTEIIKKSIARAQDAAPFERIVYLGDGGWDLKAARELSLPFIRIGVQSTESAYLMNYSNISEVLNFLKNATIPNS